MFTANACAAMEEQQLEARNCGTGQKLDCVLHVLQGHLGWAHDQTQVNSQIPRQQPWISNGKRMTRRSYQKHLLQACITIQNLQLEWKAILMLKMVRVKAVNDRSDTENIYPLKNIVVKVVFQAITIMDSSGASFKTFEDILAYGKTMCL